MSLTYSSYLHIDELLSLQQVKSDPPEHDELLFIVIHQTYELWFKQLLHEIEKVKGDFAGGHTFGAVHTFKRMRMVMKTLVGQIDIIETMTPMSFSSFRDRLEQASGFQSLQFRELEFVLGYKRSELLRYFPDGGAEGKRLRRRLEERSLVDFFYDFLETRGATLPESARAKDVSEPAAPNDGVQELLLPLFREHEELAFLFEAMTDFDEGLQEWRYRHIKLVERTIGDKPGTGGSLGVAFLKKSLFVPIFADLWAIRHRL